MKKSSSLPCTPVGSRSSSLCSSVDRSPSPCSSESGEGSGKNFLSRLRRKISKRHYRWFGSNRRCSEGSSGSLRVDYSFDRSRRLSDGSSRESLLDLENENIYRGLLRSLLHPLGVPDITLGLRPGDLVDRLKQVFEVDRDEHEYYVRDELLHRPKSLQVNITVVEGQDLSVQSTISDSHGCYCLVSIVHPTMKSRSSPSASPRHSPKMSPKIKKHSTSSMESGPGSPSGSQEWEDVLRTQTVKNNSNPQWNEEFQLAIDDFLTDEIHIFLCKSENDGGEENQGKLSPHHTHHQHHHGLRHMFRSLLHMHEHERLDNTGLGKIIIPIRDVPAMGCDWWMDLTPCGKNSKTAEGKCHLKINISHRQVDHTDEDFFSVEDYYQAAQHIYKYDLEKSLEVEGSTEASINSQDTRILDTFSISHGISQLSQTLVHVIVLLEWSSRHDEIFRTQQILNHAIQELQMVWVSKQMANISQRMPISDAEIMMYRKAASSYIGCVTDHLEDLPDLFPPSLDNVLDLQAKLGVTIQLLELDLWESKTSPHKELMQKVHQKLEEDVTKWTSEKLFTVNMHDVVVDPVIPELTTFVEIINLASSHCNPIGTVTKFYNSIGISYYRVVSFAVEKKLNCKIRELMMEMDRYQRRYHNYPVNVTASSRLSLRAFFAVRRFYAIIRDNVSRRDVFRLPVAQYQTWFSNTLVFWLQTFRTECMSRIEKALEIDKDMVVAASLVKFSNSSVDVLSCFAKITEEWRQIDYHDSDLALMGITKITDLICDGARTYTDKIQSKLERNGYYDDNETQFDVTDRLCITLNNIEHVRQYLKELPQLLDWESVATVVSTKHESEEVGERALATLNRLIDTADQEIILKGKQLLLQIMEKMKVDISRFMEIFTILIPEKASSLDELLVYLSTNLKTLHGRLMAAIYPRVIEQLWATVVTLFDEQLKTGEKSEYYRHMKQHLRALRAYFRAGLEEEKQESFIFQTLKYRLDLNAMSTEELMLEYYSSLANNMNSPSEYLGHIAIKVAYLEETRGNSTVFVKVIRASDLPGLDSSGLSDPYVVISLHPKTMFACNKSQKTKVMEQTLNPVFNTTFQFPNVPKDYLSVRGAVLVLSVLDRDHIGSDDFAGEVILNLSSISAISMTETVESRPALVLPIKRPAAVHKGAYQVIRERMSWDKSAKLFVQERQKFIDGQKERTDKPSALYNFFNFFGGKK
ncbi:hypothetical protein FSP39_018605 [Pinctada imbricata]|uniref:Uncharacterized protein n=1 Tax=Pinctada imbricata TaxID=66713 RepID=A0AA88YDW9_PINIB|nr:hypothetical protein FSP39_018605 [Pinctada imbricata]